MRICRQNRMTIPLIYSVGYWPDLVAALGFFIPQQLQNYFSVEGQGNYENF